MNKKKLITFVYFTYGISWLIWMPNVLARNFKVGWEHNNWLDIAGGLGLFLGAVITTCLFEKKVGITKYFQGKLFTLPRFKWILVEFGIPLVFFLNVWLILEIFTGEWVAFTDLGLNSKLPPQTRCCSGFYGVSSMG